MKEFKIEVLKWSWAEPVKNKNIYRDDEFVVTDTKEDALEATNYLLSRPKGLTYTITVFRDGKYFTYYRHSMPCLGGLVKYRDSHGSKHFMNPYFPRDIYVAFPEGDIIYIGLYRKDIKYIFKEAPYYEFIFSKESPWVAAFNSKDSIIFNQDSLILTDMNTDPTVFYSLMRLGGIIYGAPNKARHPKADILFSKQTSADPRRLAGQKPVKTSGGTWAQGFGYTRPYNESIFKTSLPHKLKDFGSLSGYPNAPHTTEYFHSIMKNKFNVDVSKYDAKVEAALIEAWDFFKEESSKLDS